MLWMMMMGVADSARVRGKIELLYIEEKDKVDSVDGGSTVHDNAHDG